MPIRKRALVVSTRVLRPERAFIRALAEAEDTSVCEIVHRLLIPAVRMRLSQLAAEIAPRPAPLDDFRQSPSKEPLKEADTACEYGLGWQRVWGVTPCPKMLVDLPCHDDACMCRRDPLLRILDHRKLWIDGEGNYVLTAEPYEWEGRALGSFLDECAFLGLTVHSTAKSPHNPGESMLLTIRPAPRGVPS
jgi:hypothetical protein